MARNEPKNTSYGLEEVGLAEVIAESHLEIQARQSKERSNGNEKMFLNFSVSSFNGLGDNLAKGMSYVRVPGPVAVTLQVKLAEVIKAS